MSTPALERVLDHLVAEAWPAPGQAVRRQVDTGALPVRAAVRALLTMRAPGPLPREVGDELDRVLSAERHERGQVDALSLPTLAATAGVGGALGERVALWRGDLVRLRATAVVNAANTQMLGCFAPGHACIDNALHAAAGPQLREDCQEHITAQGHLEPTGTVTVTGGHHLPADHVLHTVGPVVAGRTPTAADRAALASSYTGVLDAAADLPAPTYQTQVAPQPASRAGAQDGSPVRSPARSVGLCAVSTGVFGYPKPEAADLVVATLERWLATHPTSDLRIVVSAFTGADERVYLDALDRAGHLRPDRARGER